MLIYTSSWFSPLPETIQKIGISRGTPRGYKAGYRKLPDLAPGSWFNSVEPDEYHRRYMAQLKALDHLTILNKIAALSEGKEAAALLCYEDPRKDADWCHRGQVSAWFADHGHHIHEFGMEEHGCGWQHPKLFKGARRAPPVPVEPLDITSWLGKRAVDRNEQPWEVIGQSKEFPDQADIANLVTGEIRSVSRSVLESKFGPAA